MAGRLKKTLSRKKNARDDSRWGTKKTVGLVSKLNCSNSYKTPRKAIEKSRNYGNNSNATPSTLATEDERYTDTASIPLLKHKGKEWIDSGRALDFPISSIAF